MSKRPKVVADDSVAGGRAYYVLLALVLGLIAGAGAAALGDGLREPALQASNMVGGLWLNALKMTVIPLIVALLVTGVAKGAEAARAGRIAGRSVLWIVIVCTGSAIFGTLMIQFLLGLFPLPQAAAEALRAGLSGIDQATASAPVPGVADFFRGIIPENVIAAAANGDVLPLVVFSLLFALAAARIPEQGRRSLVGLFEAIGDALLIVIGWVLWIAPLGVFALAFTVGASAGGAAFAALAHYIVMISVIGVLVTLAGYPIAVLAGGIGLGSFTKAMIAPQSVSISTRSSLASLPAMLAAARVMGVREQVADVTLPMSVALFRATGPAMNVAVAFYVAHWLGFEPSVSQMIAATAVAAIISYGAVSLPGEISYISSIAPIAMALGVPIAPLALLVAVEMVPDIFRTLGNVTLDVAVTAAVDRGTRDKNAAA
ncbi:cation:dicarboxylate symporter family transporter [Sphingomonas sp.]|uniref:dicarboxylate/amino acid:cation symporter n=1 Tax=Sphingomonas sp. TaxID=28214 RepID=UPI00286D163E|nr:cation:dicarboxylase symporter family transporter [Sphingomonas sp.]